MNYYRRFPGDYARDTVHLSMVEDGAYGRLLDYMYSTEKPIASLDLAIRICRATGKNEKKAVEFVLGSFFYQADDGWKHKRVEEELNHAESKKEAAARSANVRWAQCKRNANAPKAHSVRDALQTPDSRHQTPDAKEEEKQQPAAQAPLVVTPDAALAWHIETFIPVETWLAFVEMRRKIRKPMTDHAVDLIHRKLVKLRDEGQDLVAVVEQSIRNSWQDVFAVREERHGKLESFDERRSRKSAAAIDTVLGRFEEAPRDFLRTLPPASE
jgi:uncharacterized protein YdaU (DUF1376 family)